MNVPKHIRELLIKRAKYGTMCNKLDSEFAKWLDSKGIQSYSLFPEPYCIDSIMLLTEPYTLSEEQYKILLKYEVKE